MAADAGIYGLIQPGRPVNPLAGLMEVQQIQSAQQQNQLAQLAFADRQRAQQEQERLRGIYAGGAQGPALEQALLQGGFADQALKFGKDRRENQKLDTDTQAKQLETAKQRLDIAGQAFGSVRNNPTPQNAAATIDYLEQNGILPPEQAAQYRQRVANAQPQEIAQLAEQAFRSTLSAKDQLPKYDTVNTGQQQVTNAIDPVTGQVRVVNTMQNTISPDADLQARTSRANNAASVGASYANAAAQREIATSNVQAARISSNAKSETDLRKEFADLPEVKKYKNAIPAYQAVVKAAQTNNPQADINLIYGLAKLYDPDSVVREGEYATIANSQAIPEWLKGQAQRLVGGGRLTEATKKQIIDQATIRKDTFQSEYDGAEQSFREIAQRRDMNPENIFPKVGEQVRRPSAPKPGAVPADINDLLNKYR